MNHTSGICAVITSLLAVSRTNVITLTPDLAQRVLHECTFVGQRPIKAHRVRAHRQRIENGTWRGNAHPITFAQLGNRMILTNGYHRCDAVRQSDVSVPISVIVVPVSSEAEARALYNEFDDPASARSVTEVLDAQQMPILLGLGKQFTEKMFKAVSIIRCGFDVRSKASGSQKIADARERLSVIQEMHDWKAEMSAYYDAYRMAKSSIALKLTVSSVAAVALYTLRYQPELAMEFWTTLARNDGLRANDPRATLIEDFATRRANSGRMDQSIIAPATAWNAFFEGRDLKMIRVVNHLRIAGTPLDKGPA